MMEVMSDTKYHDPKLKLNRIYTKGGDKGDTSLVNGRRVPKDDLKIEAYGTVDELNAFVGVACVSAQELAPTSAPLAKLAKTLVRVQHELFNLGSVLATDPGAVHPKQPQVTRTSTSRPAAPATRASAAPARSPGGSHVASSPVSVARVCAARRRA
jgi:cob(I)alamin adenosyltransferase